MRIKNCFYGQVRRMWKQPGTYCTDLPNDMASIIPNQQLITWDNATGMNPYHADFDKMKDVNVTKMSYGEMLHKTQKMDVDFFTERFNTPLKASEFDDLIKQDYKNKATSTAKLLAAWWHMEAFLRQEDILDYDYVCLRQTDTYIDDWFTADYFKQEISTKNRQVLGGENLRGRIPVVYNFQDNNPRTVWPSSNFIPSYAYILNREAVKILKGKLYQLALAEMDYYYKLLRPHDLLLTKPGIAMLRISIKHNIESISLAPLILNPEQIRRNASGAIDCSALDKCGAVYAGQDK